MKPPKFNFQYHFSRSTGPGPGPHGNVPPEFRNINLQHPAYNASKFIPFFLISSLYLSPTLQDKTTQFLDHYVITNRGLTGRDEFYYRNNVSLYGLERVPKVRLQIGTITFDVNLCTKSTVERHCSYLQSLL